jgi:hypothetical protein
MNPNGPWSWPGSGGAPNAGTTGPVFIHHDGWWIGALHVLPLLLFAVFIGVVVWGVLRLTAQSTPAIAVVGRAGDRMSPPPGSPPRDQAGDQALHELRVRYARGEVNRTDYLARYADLGGPPIPDAPADRTLPGEPPAPDQE